MSAPEGAVNTTEGPVLGIAADANVHAWLNIPFAAPPVGELRWMPPQPAACRDAPLPAAALGPACPQMNAEGIGTFGDEDCLSLNIWAPEAARTDGGNRPVLVFVHGGGNVQGSASVGVAGEALYDGTALARAEGAVVVTIQYRIGPFGWFAHPAVADAEGRTGNQGTRDQIAALRWIQNNISNFGGDPARVLLFGESAGARNVGVLLTSPVTGGLFSAALMQSGIGPVVARAAVEAEATDQIAAVATATGTDCAAAGDSAAVATCLRAVPAETWLTARPPVVDLAGPGSSAWQPFIDGEVITDDPFAVLARGEHQPVPVVFGANADETSQSAPAVLSDAQLRAYVRGLLPAFADEILAIYNAENFGDARTAFIQLTTDAKFVCTARRAAHAVAASGASKPVWLYHFTQNLTLAPRLAAQGAFHGIELFFVFDRLNLGGYRPSPGERALATAVGGFWTRFAATGDPNGAGAPEWPAYTLAGDAHLELVGPTPVAGAGLRTERCDLWDRLNDAF